MVMSLSQGRSFSRPSADDAAARVKFPGKLRRRVEQVPSFSNRWISSEFKNMITERLDITGYEEVVCCERVVSA